jgi:light-regulated signal transduction histidine kinase (bacteriophytochrome)
MAASSSTRKKRGPSPPSLTAKAEAERLRLENIQLRLDNDRLDRALQESRDLAAQREQMLQAVTDEFQQFAYAASHDLQEPLRDVNSYAKLLERSFDGGNRGATDAEIAEFLGYIQGGASRMTRLIQDLLAYSRVPQVPRRTLVSLDSVLQGVRLKLYRELSESKSSLTCDELPEVSADEAQLTQLLVHLVSNSIRFRSAAPPAIHLAAVEQPDETIVSVRDNGQGIAPQFHTQIFGVFKRLHGRDVPGTGIGLAICQKIVRGHGGRIWVESDGTSGSTFFFSLPH